MKTKVRKDFSFSGHFENLREPSFVARSSKMCCRCPPTAACTGRSWWPRCPTRCSWARASTAPAPSPGGDRTTPSSTTSGTRRGAGCTGTRQRWSQSAANSQAELGCRYLFKSAVRLQGHYILLTLVPRLRKTFRKLNIDSEILFAWTKTFISLFPELL